MRIAAIFIALAAAAVASPTLSACPGATVASASPVLQLYDPFSPSPTQLAFDVVIRNPDAQGCSVDLMLQPDGGVLKLGGAIDYGFVQPGGLASGALVGPVTVQVPAKGEQTVSFVAELPVGAVVSPDTYQQRLGLTVSSGGVPIVTDRAISLSTLVPARSQMSISGVSSPGRGSLGMAPPSIDFKTLETGENARVFINVWANTSVQVTLTSDHGGVMQHEDGPQLPSVPYSVTIDGEARSLAGPATIGRNPPMSLSGASYPLVVTVGDVSGRYAGRYQDVITVSVNPQ
ncbi:hypothetical protein [Brevundimonas lutea]|uniref:hypothetical protein n=1 Tax=Brevundimonas lutea TaxID=2293980 RepID=UPI000F0320E0|nr:hypothetical protein [Brevundimonas lutea]